MRPRQIVGDLEQYIAEFDEYRLERGEPIVSALISESDGTVCSAFWKTIKRHPHLRMEGESDVDLIVRLQREAFAYHQGTIQ